MASYYNYNAQGAHRMPPASPLNPTAQPFYGSPQPVRGIPIVILQRPTQPPVQHSPPHRPYHEPMTVSPMTPQLNTGFDESLMDRLEKMIEEKQEDRMDMLEAVKKTRSACDKAEQDLDELSYYGDTEAYLRSRRVLERQIGKFQDMHAEYGNAFEVLGYELDELYADMAVAKTGNYYN